MNLHERLAAQARLNALKGAVKTLQSIPEFADVQVQVADRTEQIRKSMAADAGWGSDARMQHLVQMFDVYGGEYLRLVHDLETQTAYEIILVEFYRSAFEEFTGFQFESVRLYGNKSEPLMDRIRSWTVKGYRKIASLSRKGEGLPEQPERSQTERLAADRKARINPILLSKGMSASRWAAAAGVDPSVVYDYLAGKSMPRRENKKALADSIGVQVSDLAE
jgi:hypothetical protein